MPLHPIFISAQAVLYKNVDITQFLLKSCKTTRTTQREPTLWVGSFLRSPLCSYYAASWQTLHAYFLSFGKTYPKGVICMDGQELVKQTLDQIPQANANAKRIVGLVKEGGRITGYQLSDNSVVEKQQAVNMAKQGQIAGVGIAHRGDTEYLKSIPDGSENNNLGNLPSVSPTN